LFAILSALGFAGKAIFIKLAYSAARMDATTLLTLRMIFSAPFFVAMGLRASANESLKPLERRDWLGLSVLAFLGYYFSSFLDFLGLEYISAALERIILFTYPTWVLLISVSFLGRKFEARDFISLALSTLGIVVTFFNDLKFAGDAGMLWRGAALVLGASFVYSFYLLGSRDVVLRVGSSRFTGYVALIASVYVFVQFGLTRPLENLRQPAEVYWLSLGLAVVSTVLPIICLVQALKRVSPAMVAVCSSIGPILTILMGGIFLGEPVTAMQLAGAVLVLAGVGLITKPPAGGADNRLQE
jgi:drug/metabolite transporter (DMT)-like permease